MAKIPVDDAPAGPAMDAAVARAVGCDVKTYPPGQPASYYCGCSESYPHGDSATIGLKRYSSGIAAAWRLVETMAQRSGTDPARLAFGAYVEQAGVSEFEREPLWSLSSAEAALRVSRAFLKVHGVEFVEAEGGEES